MTNNSRNNVFKWRYKVWLNKKNLYIRLSSSMLGRTTHNCCKSSGIRLYRLCTSGYWYFHPLLLASCSSSVRLNGDRWWIVIFKSGHRVSIRLRSGLWLGHLNTFRLLVLTICLGLLSCWNVNLHPSSTWIQSFVFFFINNYANYIGFHPTSIVWVIWCRFLINLISFPGCNTTNVHRVSIYARDCI